MPPLTLGWLVIEGLAQALFSADDEHSAELVCVSIAGALCLVTAAAGAFGASIESLAMPKFLPSFVVAAWKAEIEGSPYIVIIRIFQFNGILLQMSFRIT